MLILLPPSETKRAGGTPRALDLDTLAFPALGGVRARVIDALAALSRDRDEAARVLKLSERQRGEIVDNEAVRSGRTMAAVDRYTGVLFDALGAEELDSAARRWLGSHVLIHSAPLGPVRALDRIPMYRLSAGTSLPGLPALRRMWSEPVTRAFAEASPSFVLDLRSEAYVALGPVPPTVPSAYVRVVARSTAGTVRALNHFNKHTKGELVRQLALSRPRVGSLHAFLSWARDAGWQAEQAGGGEIHLFARD